MAVKKVGQKRGRVTGMKFPGGYKPPHMRRETATLRLPVWLLEKLGKKEINFSRYIESLILKDLGWQPPKK